MKWIETIELRTTGRGESLKRFDLKPLASRLQAESKPYRVVRFRHATVKGDISIHLLFDTAQVPPEGSELGLRLKEMLRGSGLVSHKIWLETESYLDLEDNETIDT